jgi:peptidoglycan/xylan/chitin deacetylase (PgdA/CDA1 family)
VLCALLANQALLTLLGLWPRSTGLGPNITQLPAAAAARMQIVLTIDDGPDPDVTPQVLDILDRHAAKATFFCIGNNAVRHQALCREIVQRGHTIENHSQRHSYAFAFSSTSACEREIQAAQQTLARSTGRAPRYFRAPAGIRSPLLDPVLGKLGLRLVAWTRRGFDTVNGNPLTILRRLQPGVKAGSILLLHDGRAARTSTGTPVIVEVLPALLTAATDAGLHWVTLSAALEHDAT